MTNSELSLSHSLSLSFSLCNWNSKSFLVWQFCKRNCRCLALVIVFCVWCFSFARCFFLFAQLLEEMLPRSCFFFFFFFEGTAPRNGSQLDWHRGSVLCDEGFSNPKSLWTFFFYFFFWNVFILLASWQGWHLALGIPVSVAVFFESFQGSRFCAPLMLGKYICLALLAYCVARSLEFS